VFQDIHKAQNVEKVYLNIHLSNRGFGGVYFDFVCFFFCIREAEVPFSQ